MKRNRFCHGASLLRDYGKEPLVINMDHAAKINSNYRIALWTGEYLQVTLMSIPVGGDIGLEVHPDTDQFLRIEKGHGISVMGRERGSLTQRRRVGENDAIIVPAGTWHNVINKGREEMKLYSIYAPPHHPFGTVHPTKEDGERGESESV